MKIRDAKLAVLDTNVFADLASQDTTRQKITAERLDALRREGLLTAVTGTIITEIAATLGNVNRLKTLIDTLVSRVEVYLPFQAGDLVRIELSQQDPASVIGDQTLYSTSGLTKVLDAVREPDVEAFFRGGGLQHTRLRSLLPRLDVEIEKLTADDLPTFTEHAERSALEHVKAFLESANAEGQLGEWDRSTDALNALLVRGRATKMAVLMVVANHYRRAKRWVEKKEKTKAGGALSDTRILSEAAYAQVLLTTDKEFVACGELVNEVIPEPCIRRWE